ncbi:MAG TPA: hypothetical protein ENN17_01855 [bacterium]|nr:hypothetical protein [bacterium]
MKRIRKSLVVLFLIGISGMAQAQMAGLYGDAREHRNGLHAGNQFRTTFYNDGTYGQITSPPDIGGEWPINSGHQYLIDGNTFVGSEVIDRDGDLKHIMSTVQSCNIQYSRGDQGPAGEWWTFLPLPGFFNPDDDRVAMSKWPEAWPAHWPDIADPSNPRFSPDGWRGSWNGYFGRDQFSADEESYFVADDYQNREFNFYPDSLDENRRGLGIRKYVRGLQWSNALVEDAIFILFDLENIGTHHHDKMVFGYKIGNDLGNTLSGLQDTGDDCGAYDRDLNLAYMWDGDNIGAGGWSPVGWFGAALLETPGNHYDGIDNDGDGIHGPGPIISETMFAPRTLNAGDDIVVIDYTTFERTVMKMPNDTLRIRYQDRILKYWPGQVIRELPHNLIDDNLDGIIDENNGVTFGDPPVTTYLNVGRKYINYFTGEGLDNPMIDERRDDGIDNDGDWDPERHDVGADGVPFTFDQGEGDGVPTPGEPNFDQTDIDETDMLGITSFALYFWPDIPLYDDEAVWSVLIPGRLDDLYQFDNVELFFGSGYFPMKAGETQRFSMSILCGIDKDDLFENKRWVTHAYGENYRFAQAPDVPTVKAVAGDNRVTLIWDSKAEDSFDPITGHDFEGYRIYRSTDPGFNDMTPITDGMGSVTFRKPLAQFDLDNEYQGYAAVPIKGVQFWLGTNTGLVHTYIDTTAKNGFTYYYAVISYDRGSDSLGIPPSECSKFISVNQDGSIDKGPNVAVVRPEAPSAGFVAAGLDSIKSLPGGSTDGFIAVEVIFPDSVRDGHTYRVTFNDTTLGTGRRLYPATRSFNLVDVTTGETLIEDSPDFTEGLELPETHGFRLSFHNVYPQLALNSDLSGWNRSGLYPLAVREYSYNPGALDLQVGDFAIIFGELGIDTSTAFTRQALEPAIPVNFTVWNLTQNRKMKFALRDLDANPGEEGLFTGFTSGRGTRRDEIIILTDSLVGGWEVTLLSSQTDTLLPQPGDTAFVITDKPFLSNDVFEFTMRGEKVDAVQAKTDLNDIRVVPNPYVVTNSWEPRSPFSSGRGPRELHFINLPARCTIRIFNIRGQLVDTIEHHSAALSDGTVIWDMLTKDNLEIAYGVYVYHVDAGDLGTKIGKFAVIK